MEPKTDRRVRKTKKLLRQGLATLMNKKSISEITVKELVEEVDINRSTFYLHYTDIFDMLKKIEDELMNELMDIITSSEEQLNNVSRQGYPYLVRLFTVLDNNRDICKALSGPHGDLSFINKIEAYIEKNTNEYASRLFLDVLEKDLPYIHAYCITGCVGMVKKWISNDAPESPEHMAKLTFDMLTNSLESYLKK